MGVQLTDMAVKPEGESAALDILHMPVSFLTCSNRQHRGEAPQSATATRCTTGQPDNPASVKLTINRNCLTS